MERIVIEDGYNDLTHEMFEKILYGEAHGTIVLATPVLNINEWYKTNPSVYSLVLNMSEKDIEKIAYFASAAITDPGNSRFSDGEVVSNTDIEAELSEGKEFSFLYGAPGISHLLEKADLKAMYNEAREREVSGMGKLQKLYEKLDAKYGEDEIPPDEDPDEMERIKVRSDVEKARALLDAVNYVRKHKDRLFIDQINMIPLELRTLLQKAVKSCAYGVLHDIKSLYTRVAARNARLKKLMEVNAPAIIINNESRILQEYVDSLIANGKRGRTVVKDNNGDDTDMRCTLMSLTDVAMKYTQLV